MTDFRQIMQRTGIKEMRSLFIEGLDLFDNGRSRDSRAYEQRLQEEERPIYKLLEQTFTDEKELDSAVEKLSRALLVNENVYMELGMQTGAKILFELLREG